MQALHGNPQSDPAEYSGGRGGDGEVTIVALNDRIIGQVLYGDVRNCESLTAWGKLQWQRTG